MEEVEEEVEHDIEKPLEPLEDVSSVPKPQQTTLPEDFRTTGGGI
jgi:hypothetical protein